MPNPKKPPTPASRLQSFPGIGKQSAALLLEVAYPKRLQRAIPARHFGFGSGQRGCKNQLAGLLRHGLVEWAEQGKTVRLTEKVFETIDA